jgi:hypothetical protein
VVLDILCKGFTSILLPKEEHLINLKLACHLTQAFSSFTKSLNLKFKTSPGFDSSLIQRLFSCSRIALRQDFISRMRQKLSKVQLYELHTALLDSLICFSFESYSSCVVERSQISSYICEIIELVQTMDEKVIHFFIATVEYMHIVS